MNVIASIMGKATSLVLSVALLFGMGPDAYGLHHCVHHHPAPQTSGTSISVTSCSMDCPGCLHSPPHIAGAAVDSPRSDQLPAVDLSPFARGPLGPRHGLFESYRPNAPPRLA